MRKITLTAGIIAGLISTAALAQTPPATIDGARPGNVIGTGSSLPMSDTASNTNSSNTRSTIAPNLRTARMSESASPRDLLRTARGALVAGRTGEAQEALERVQTRALSRSVVATQARDPSSSEFVRRVGDALQAVGNRDRAGAISIIDEVLGGPTPAEFEGNGTIRPAAGGNETFRPAAADGNNTYRPAASDGNNSYRPAEAEGNGTVRPATSGGSKTKPVLLKQ